MHMNAFSCSPCRPRGGSEAHFSLAAAKSCGICYFLFIYFFHNLYLFFCSTKCGELCNFTPTTDTKTPSGWYSMFVQ
ncbi:hypothetical protein GOODEAATRI_029541 [Goodea atripinnis]|uniref:Uncharacterized protein n=1 Tax=Goodea atripinnis TaxID=208336 RepID=A0ABV0MLR3_9TELE